MRARIKSAFLLAVSLAVLGPAPVSPQSPVDDPEVQAQIDLFSAWLEGQIAIRGLPGVVAGVVSGDDLVWAQGFGYADVESERPMETDTRFRMASHSKLFTATAMMQLREEGRVALAALDRASRRVLTRGGGSRFSGLLEEGDFFLCLNKISTV